MMGFQVVVEQGHVTISEGQNVLDSYFLPNWRDQMEESLDGGDYVESVYPLCFSISPLAL
jgi:hypothetical protein